MGGRPPETLATPAARRFALSTTPPLDIAPGADTPARVRAAMVRQLHDAGAVPPPVEVTPVPELRRDPGHGAQS